ncbi:site-2 protease family protein [Gemmatimonas sp.]|uniref:site-2 protease family protein n=1 Tax=Gemmatimonas sp. TaxID=1962908 RepID=UPI003DA29103
MDFAQQLALVFPVLLFSMVAHEYAHGYAAMRQGDMTAYQLGRLTWNPIKHIDPFMTVIVPVMLAFLGGPIFGGAKPVPVNPRNYRNYRRGDIIVSLAGVTVNVIIALACVPLIIAVGLLGQQFPAIARPLFVLQLMFNQGIIINLVLAAFNLIPHSAARRVTCLQVPAAAALVAPVPAHRRSRVFAALRTALVRPSAGESLDDPRVCRQPYCAAALSAVFATQPFRRVTSA